jgi:enoyl-CoA hydratase/carnithine racemase
MTRYQLQDVADGIASITIATDADPHVSTDDVDGLARVAAALEHRPDLRALLVEGGERTFCGGADRATLLGCGAAAAIHDLVGNAARRLLALPIPTVAVMRGHAVGGGLLFGLWCDAAVLARESLYAANFVDLGFTPGMGSTALLPELLGAPFARELLLTGRTLLGRELAERAPALAHAVVPRAEVRDRALSLADDLARPSAVAVRLTKAHFSRGRLAMLERALAEERAMHEAVFGAVQTRRHIAARYVGSSP